RPLKHFDGWHKARIDAGERGLGISHAAAPERSEQNDRQNLPASSVVGRPSAEEMSRDYQFSAHIASVCCIATGVHERRQMWVVRVDSRWPGVGPLYPDSDRIADTLERQKSARSGLSSSCSKIAIEG